MTRQRLFLILALIAICPGKVHATYSEPQVIGAFVFNFLKFAEFPTPHSVKHNPSQIVICSPTSEVAKEYFGSIDGKEVVNRVVTVRVFSKVDEVGECDVVFIARGSVRSFSELLIDSQRLGVLTFGMDDTFLLHGGMIRFYPENGMVRFEIARKRVERSGIRLSSKVLSLAKIYEEED